MWSWRLSKIKKSIANPNADAETRRKKLSQSRQMNSSGTYFFTKIGQWQHLLELIVASNVLAMVLALAEARSWHALEGIRVLQYTFFINWVILSFSAFVDYFQDFFTKLSQKVALTLGFVVLQIIVLLTTCAVNIIQFWAARSTGFSEDVLFHGVSLHLGYGILLGAFCLRYLYMREQWLRQQYSELNARIQAMQARIHPHFLFNSLNSVVSLISIDPDKAENMLISLSRLFRASFQELKLVSLEEEIDLCKQYLSIEKMRLGDRLTVEWNIQATPIELKRATIPLLTLQPLLENSIFHGVEKVLQASTISVLVEILQNQVTIVITNPYSHDKIKSRTGNGIAIENVEQRLKAYYGPAVKFQVYGGVSLYTTVVSYHDRVK
ncbi:MULTISPECIES: sensor histidine kinase [Acinetobacter]|jgi:two-component system sensor histidine kinase AlgZ|uniref:Alginate biosynthesis protein n=5 Tax=Gammaproteobacteria TaxID=1236 RepID=A0A365PGK7_ACIJU|nr:MULTISPECIES: histidine kinase [Acinetobacter]EEY92058.1 histidine kinase [Acinetobacter junii SH205]MBJ8441982.1 histidine kinase [Acinetobacter junii]MCE6005145.1 histidine kinase [Acinetobacter junii]MDA3502585.1 histidine kinase [Acinetobacter sp. AOR34_HL]MDH1003904.1 histidine kinase [Acinetobacter junii]